MDVLKTIRKKKKQSKNEVKRKREREKERERERERRERERERERERGHECVEGRINEHIYYKVPAQVGGGRGLKRVPRSDLD